ncbi:MAG: peptidoglycan-binding lysin domain protein [Deltaproteobacteria bacterium]|jgi:tetratricopeptide (TPR) repeat protein|nr:peptidoglycan-binding lysin domain protein [Deltaproteobacteria bacterium]
MKNRFFGTGAPFFLSLILVSLLGCATSPDKGKESLPSSSWPGTEISKDPFTTAAEQYRLKARRDEKNGDLPRALKSWKIVESFLPDDNEARGKIAQMKKQILEGADQHFQKGRAFFYRHSYLLARKEFLSVLYLRPDHEGALQYLKEKMAGEDFFLYEVKKGDTLKDLAAKFYEDPQKAFVVARLNDLKVDSLIEPNRVLRFPILGSARSQNASPSLQATPHLSPQAEVGFQEYAGKAKEAYQRGDYRESASLAEKSLSSDPENREFRELINASYYEMGSQLGREKKYDEALKAFQRVDPGYRDRDIQLIHNRKQLAEVHYLQGVKFFIEEEIERAIQEWETTLKLEPGHPKAITDIEKGRNLLYNFKKIN